MRYLALACDYDGTLATDGAIDPATLAALRRLRDSGRRLLLVTGRRLEELRAVCPHLELFDRIVAENGALLVHPPDWQTVALGEPPPAPFVAALRAAGVAPMAVGEVIVATWEPHQAQVLETIRALGLELQVIFNKGAVMVLPSGINKATGLIAALRELGLSPRNAVGVGDAENDHAFLTACECGVAVANALPMLQERSDWVTRGDHGAGVVEVVEALLLDDLSALAPLLTRHHVLLGERPAGPLMLPPAGVTALLAGPPGSGASTLARGLLERLGAAGYQVCVIDAHAGDDVMPGAAVLGDRQRAPSVDGVIELLAAPSQHVVVNVHALAAADQPAFLAALLPRLQELRARSGRPHWIAVDEAHRLMPATRGASGPPLQVLDGLLLMTAHPERLPHAILAEVNTVLAVGRAADATLRAVPRSRAAAHHLAGGLDLPPGEGVVWSVFFGDTPQRFSVVSAKLSDPVG